MLIVGKKYDQGIKIHHFIMTKRSIHREKVILSTGCGKSRFTDVCMENDTLINK